MTTYMKKFIEGISQSKGRVGETDWLAIADPSDRYYGFENFGNTCYSNSVIQALFYCRPFRDCALHYTFPHSTVKLVIAEENLNINQFQQKSSANTSEEFTAKKRLNNLDAPLESSSGSSSDQANVKNNSGIWNNTAIGDLVSKIQTDPSLKDTLFGSLQTLFAAISNQKKQCGVLGPKQFMTKLKEENEIFASTMQQDAHEMFNYLINEISDTLINQKKEIRKELERHGLIKEAKTNESSSQSLKKTWIHELFEGQLTNETICRSCESVTNRDEPFLDLSVDIEQHSSLSTCLRHFSTSEVLSHKNKFFCDTCNSLQEAEKKMKIKKLPNILAVHLKRFKYQEQLGRFSKLSYRVAFTEKLGLFNTVDETENSDRIYDLCAIIVHIGSGPHHGHYVAVVKTSKHQWLLFDDEEVTPLEETELAQYFGEANLGTGYFFIYNDSNYSSDSLIKSMMPDGWTPPPPPIPVTPISSPINSILRESEPTDREDPSIIASKEVDDGEENTSQTSLPIIPPRMPNPRVVKPKAGGTPPSIIDTKRPSLPIVNIAHYSGAVVSPGPATANVAMDSEEQKNSWGWFSKKDKAKK